MAEENLIAGIGDELFEQLLSEEEAILESAGVYENVGKVTNVYTEFYVRENGVSRKVTPQEYQNVPRFTKGISKSQLVHVEVDIQEFNPELSFNYDKWVAVRKNQDVSDGNGKKVKTVKSDWAKYFVPSLKEVTGIDDTVAALRYIVGKYVSIKGVTQQPSWNTPDPEVEGYTTIKFERLFDNREEAYAYYQSLRSGGNSDTDTTVDYDSNIVEGVNTLAKLGKSHSEIANSLGLTVEDVENILA